MDADIARTAALFADPTRAAVIGALMSGVALTPTELARSCKVAPSTMTGHLDRLVAAGAVERRSQGRHRYYRLADPRVAQAYEALSLASDLTPATSLRQSSRREALRQARSCYDHLAGRAGVDLLAGLVGGGHLVPAPDGLALSGAGEQAFAHAGVVVMAGRRRFAFRCLDWTERRDHLAGGLGAAVLSRALEAGWLLRQPGSRALSMTTAGTDAFAGLVGSGARSAG